MPEGSIASEAMMGEFCYPTVHATEVSPLQQTHPVLCVTKADETRGFPLFAYAVSDSGRYEAVVHAVLYEL